MRQTVFGASLAKPTSAFSAGRKTLLHARFKCGVNYIIDSHGFIPMFIWYPLPLSHFKDQWTIGLSQYEYLLTDDIKYMSQLWNVHSMKMGNFLMFFFVGWVLSSMALQPNKIIFEELINTLLDFTVKPVNWKRQINQWN